MADFDGLQYILQNLNLLRIKKRRIQIKKNHPPIDKLTKVYKEMSFKVQSITLKIFNIIEFLFKGIQT